MLQFLARLAGEPDSDDDDDEDTTTPTTPTTTPILSKETTSFLDLGCGNGSILFSLRDNHWAGPLAGVDYSPRSVALAKQVAATHSSTSPPSSSEILFSEYDILNGPPMATVFPSQATWDVVLDKGTFDAISLSDATDARGRRVCEGYKERVLPMVATGGLFLITSCNWTEQELRGWFVGGEPVDGARFEEAGRVKYRTFSFGGVQGQTISTLCFRKI